MARRASRRRANPATGRAGADAAGRRRLQRRRTLPRLYWTSYGDEEHALGRAILAPYQLGSSDSAAEHRLLADRFGHALEVGLALDVGQLLATQPSELAAAVEILGAERARQLIEQQIASPRRPDIRKIHAGLERCRQLVAELAGWLDDTVTRLQR